MDSLIATTVFGIVLAITAYFGFRITLHHRSVEIRKFTHILNIEEKLGLHRKGLLADVRPPEAISWADVFKPRKSNTPLFILRMHGAVMLFAVLYVASRWFLQLGAWPR